MTGAGTAGHVCSGRPPFLHARAPEHSVSHSRTLKAPLMGIFAIPERAEWGVAALRDWPELLLRSICGAA